MAANWLHPAIGGMAFLEQELFILRVESSDIEVYNSTTFCLKRRIAVDGMRDPGNVASCTVNKCLYIAESRYLTLVPAILRVCPIGGNVIKVWSTLKGRNLLSVASDSNVILSSNDESRIREYTADGELIRRIYIGWITGGIDARHAVKLANDLFVVCYSDHPGTVCLLSVKETSQTLGRTDDVEIVKEFDAEPIDILEFPVHLIVGKKSSVLVLDSSKHRALLLSSNLDKPLILISDEDGMKASDIACLDDSTGKWLFTDGRRIMVCQVEKEKVKRQLHDLRSE